MSGAVLSTPPTNPAIFSVDGRYFETQIPLGLHLCGRASEGPAEATSPTLDRPSISDCPHLGVPKSSVKHLTSLLGDFHAH